MREPNFHVFFNIAIGPIEGDRATAFSRSAFVAAGADAAEYNRLKRDPEWLDEWFLAAWQEIADRRGLQPKADECLGWKVHPLVGGQIEVDNLQVFSLRLYQSLMAQLHRQLRSSPR